MVDIRRSLVCLYPDEDEASSPLFKSSLLNSFNLIFSSFHPPFYITDYHHKPHGYLSFHLCFSSKCLKVPTTTCEEMDSRSKLA